MHCVQCGAVNPDSDLYCGKCGAALPGPDTAPEWLPEEGVREELAASQRAVHRLRRYIPPVVAEAILHDHERLRGERREVTILFADAMGFTRLSESLDAESVFDLINNLLGRLVECIHHYGGTVDKFTGDGLMAVFGAPIAHENDPELAIRAALAMQEAATAFEPVALAQLGAPLRIRIGIHSGPAVAGILGTPEQAAYTVIGRTVNLASRVESLAHPGHVLVSERTYQLTHALFHFQAMGTAAVKGIDQPVPTYEALGERAAPLPTRGVTGITDAFFGRSAELEQLRGLAAAFLDGGHGRLIAIVGEAGLGKTRLVAEGLSSLTPDRAAIWRGRGLPYAQGVGYGLFRTLLQDAQRAHPSGSVLPEPVSSELRPFLQQVLGQPLSAGEQDALRHLEPERVKQLTLLALREWLLGEARRQPVVLILEDVHWADDLSLEALRSLIGLIYEATVLLCIITRPRRELGLDTVRAPPDETPVPLRHLSLEIGPLSQEHCGSLLAHLVNLDTMPEPFVDTILTRAQGNPFYIEEYVRTLIGREALTRVEGRWRVAPTVSLQDLETPTTLRGLMMARVDRLSQELQEAVRSAAVIGLQFSADLLEAVERRMHGPVNVAPLLERLRDLGLMVERPRMGERVYAFRHIITQETVYSSLLRSQRPDLHRIVAECIESLHASDLDSQAEVLALHYDRARVHDRAMHYMLLAGDRARARFSNREAIEYYGRALQHSQHLSDRQAERWRAAVGLGEVEQHVGEYEEAIALYQAALAEWSEAEPAARAHVILSIAQVWVKRGDLERADQELHRGLSELGRTGSASRALRAQILAWLGIVSRRRGDLVVAQKWLMQGLELVEHTEHFQVLSLILNQLGRLYSYRGDWERAVESVKRALGLCERLGEVVGYARCVSNLAILNYESGDWDSALANFSRAVESHRRIGEVEGLVLASTNLGLLYTERGEWDKAEQNLRTSFEIAQRIAHPYELAQAHASLGRLYLLQGRWSECAHHLDTAVQLYREAGALAHLNLNDAYHYQGVLYLEQGQIETALAWAGRSYELLREATGIEEGKSAEWARYRRLMGRIALKRGDLGSARRHLEESVAILGASGSQIETGRTAYWLALLLAELGQHREARGKLNAASRVFEQLGAAADLERARMQLARLEGS